MNDSTPGDSTFLAASVNFIREFSAEKQFFQSASFPAPSGRHFPVLAHGHQMELETLFDFGFYKYAARRR
jgi:hypothetical protein